MASAKEASPRLRDSSNEDVEQRTSVANVEKGKWERLWPVIACGAGLFSDGYLNNVRRHQSDTLPNAALTKAPPQHSNATFFHSTDTAHN
jgi:hypothetical protein